MTPTPCGRCRPNPVTNSLAIALAHLSNHLPLGIIGIPAVTAIPPCLLAADKHLWRSINSGKHRGITIEPLLSAFVLPILIRWDLLPGAIASCSFFGFLKFLGWGCE